MQTSNRKYTKLATVYAMQYSNIYLFDQNAMRKSHSTISLKAAKKQVNKQHIKNPICEWMHSNVETKKWCETNRFCSNWMYSCSTTTQLSLRIALVSVNQLWVEWIFQNNEWLLFTLYVILKNYALKHFYNI